MVAQVDRRDRAERVLARDRGSKPVRRDADAHSTLDDGQQFALAQAQWLQVCG
jgi:hypothetical protein